MPELLPPPSECANCGATIPRNAKACPGCGADERTGWRESSLYDGLDLPESAWSEEGDEAQGNNTTPRVNGIAWYWWCVGAVLLFLLITRFVSLG